MQLKSVHGACLTPCRLKKMNQTVWEMCWHGWCWHTHALNMTLPWCQKILERSTGIQVNWTDSPLSSYMLTWKEYEAKVNKQCLTSAFLAVNWTKTVTEYDMDNWKSECEMDLLAIELVANKMTLLKIDCSNI